MSLTPPPATLVNKPAPAPTSPGPSGPPKSTPPSPGTPATATTTPAFKLSTEMVGPPPPKILLYAVEGWGKTTFATHAPNPVVIMSREETGYLTLLGEGRVPLCPHAVVNTWPEVLGAMDALAREPGTMKTLILDALGGFERLCHEYVCAKDFSNDWSNAGFTGFAAGNRASIRELLLLISRLEKIRSQGIAVIILSHVKKETTRNPGVPEYDSWAPAIAKETYAEVGRWADTILFGNFTSAITKGKTDKDKGRASLYGGGSRVVFTDKRDAFAAKNRYGMELEIPVPDDPEASFAVITQNITFFKKG